MPASDLLLLSNSSVHDRGYLEHARDAIPAFFPRGSSVAFAPFALADHDDYTGRARSALEPLGITVIGLHTVDSDIDLLRKVDGIFVGGGNSFRLLKALQERNLIDMVRDMVSAGKLRYMGSSAGTNMSCPSLRTSNDMPIVQPTSFESFGLIPFQINPHYLDPDLSSTHMGETREKRIRQFHEENNVPVLGMREGAWLRRVNGQLTLEGNTGARLFRRGEDPVEYTEGADLTFLMDIKPLFDVGPTDQSS